MYVAEGGRAGRSVSGTCGTSISVVKSEANVSDGSGAVQVTEADTIGGDVNGCSGYGRIDGRTDCDVRVGVEMITGTEHAGGVPAERATTSEGKYV